MTTVLASFVFEWIEREKTKPKWLAAQAGIPHSTFTLLKRGYTPAPDTLRKLADGMRVPRRRLFVLAGYVREEELEPEAVSLTETEREFLAGFRALATDEQRAALYGALQGLLVRLPRRGTPVE